MGRPTGNGLIELVDEKSQDKGFFCMQLVAHIQGRRISEGVRIWDIEEQR